MNIRRVVTCVVEETMVRARMRVRFTSRVSVCSERGGTGKEFIRKALGIRAGATQ